MSSHFSADRPSAALPAPIGSLWSCPEMRVVTLQVDQLRIALRTTTQCSGALRVLQRQLPVLFRYPRLMAARAGWAELSAQRTGARERQAHIHEAIAWAAAEACFLQLGLCYVSLTCCRPAASRPHTNFAHQSRPRRAITFTCPMPRQGLALSFDRGQYRVGATCPSWLLRDLAIRAYKYALAWQSATGRQHGDGVFLGIGLLLRIRDFALPSSMEVFEERLRA